VSLYCEINLRDNIIELLSFRREWTLEYVDAFILRVQETIKKHLDVDYRSGLRDATEIIRDK